jgi:nitrate reductase gamma subunit
MSQFAYLLTYLALVVFILAALRRIVAYKKNPMHLRWELYPVPHEGGGRASYGGGYLEELEWWNKPRETSRIRELSVMIPEMLFLKAAYEHNRPLWMVSFPFHFGLYLTFGLVALLVVGAVAELAGLPADSGLVGLVVNVATILGPIAFGLSLVGAFGLLRRRLRDPALRDYSAMEHYFNLALFIAAMGVALITWASVDPSFEMARGFIAGLITFNLKEVDSSLFLLQVILAVVTLAYIPFTHMSHFFMKYFLYHDIRWEDKPNVDAPEINERLGEVLGFEPTWSAEHVAIPGKKTWADIATFNPAAEPEENQKTE